MLYRIERKPDWNTFLNILKELDSACGYVGRDQIDKPT
jgi:hypothetical protein